MSGLGVCGGCGALLGDGALQLALETGPGPRGLAFTSVSGTRLDRFDVCAACIAGEQAAGTILARMLDDQYTRALRPAGKHCTIACQRPRRRTTVFLARRTTAEFENAYCPVCFGPADVTEAPGARPVQLRWRDRLRNRVPLRETWNMREIPPA